MITTRKAIYNLFGSGIYQKIHYIFKSKSYEFHNKNLSLFSVNDTMMSGYFFGIHKYIFTRKLLIETFFFGNSKVLSSTQNFWSRG